MEAFERLMPRQMPEMVLETRGDTTAPQILTTVGILTGLSGLLVVLRCYVRLAILRRFDIDDWIMILALACAFGVLGCFIGETEHGLGHYSADIGLNDRMPLNKYMFFHAIIIVTGISSVKISLGFFLLRFTSQNKVLRKILIGTLIFLVIFTISCCLSIVFQCYPVSAAWDFAQKQTATCYSMQTYLAVGQFNSAINIITDFAFATLPVFMFWNIQVNKRTKASLMGILGLGYFACGAAIAKTVFQSRVFDDPNAFRIEFNVGILAACFPTIKPLVKSVIGSTWSLATGSRPRKRTTNAYYAHSSSHAMGSMARSRIDHEAQKYNVRIDGIQSSLSASERGSEENLEAQRHVHRFSSQRILRTTEVIVHTEGGSDMGDQSIGPVRTVEDRI
ncbi:uncharacterized protein ACLA_063640 [Aspergillus clavatus NRRL 1]|uniref:Rhodopsin domain-containing protein n=1 Tax=Aspergillus clavatus (strain ATCC 1007 / CBS 513.65 / DSM 816 / NCTC 3887 / NRRL 1 / QM 1276 / 107) TaxID=344612 RepID=A1CCY8_ASPCL|nr:uncharacterized protein ACLA_063640 [Aspergillus clavatus NRRL 1]EAW12395.1 conserved hypothetical protein [Aspergillus clavatus NRRL 1]